MSGWQNNQKKNAHFYSSVSHRILGLCCCVSVWHLSSADKLPWELILKSRMLFQNAPLILLLSWHASCWSACFVAFSRTPLLKRLSSATAGLTVRTSARLLKRRCVQHGLAGTLNVPCTASPNIRHRQKKLNLEMKNQRNIWKQSPWTEGSI